MKRIVCSLLLMMGLATTMPAQVLWIESADHYSKPKSLDLSAVDSVIFRYAQVRTYKNGAMTNHKFSDFLGYTGDGKSVAMSFKEPDQRLIWKPSTSDNNYNNDYTNPESQWSFKRSKESEHWIVYWDKCFGDDPNASTVPSNLRVNVDDLLMKAEQFYATNVDKLKMADLGENKSRLDEYKMIIHLLYDDGWTAVGSGYDDMVGALWVTPSTCHPVGSTIAHETGHCFQYQVACDYRKSGVSNYTQRGWRYGFGSNGSGGNAFWEQCAQWQAMQDYPSEAFGYHCAVWLMNYHRHVCHEWMRYASYWWQYQLVEKHGYEAYGQLWRGSRYPEDPLETYTRLFCDGNWDTFWDEYFDYATKLQNYQFEAVHQYLSSNYSARQYSTKLFRNDDDTYQVAYASCPETSGVNFIRLTGFTQGSEIKVHFTGMNPGDALHASDPGKSWNADPAEGANANKFTKVTKYNTAGKAADRGWHYAFVAVTGSGVNSTTTVSEVCKDAEGDITFTVPQGTIVLSLCVVATPKNYTRHAWDETDINDAQWPYRVSFEGCKPTTAQVGS